MFGKPKEENYFDLFIGGIGYTCRVAEATLQMVKNYVYTDVKKQIDAIHKIEHAGDEHFHKLYEQLMKSFVTPIEREDILEIAQKIDNITDLVEDVANRFYMFDIKEIRADAVPFMEKVVECCDVTMTALKEFKNFAKSKSLHDKILKVNDLEEVGDRMYMAAVRGLFIEEKGSPVKRCSDPIEVWKWREIYHKMELCMDACEDLVDEMEGVSIKNT